MVYSSMAGSLNHTHACTHACKYIACLGDIVACRKHRQSRNVTLILLEACLQWINLVFYILPNAFNVADPCYFFDDKWFYFGFARWTCWNTVSHLNMFCMHSKCEPLHGGKLWVLGLTYFAGTVASHKGAIPGRHSASVLAPAVAALDLLHG